MRKFFHIFSSLHFLCMYCLFLTLLWYIGFFGTIHPSLWQNNNLRNNIHCKEPTIRTRKEHLLYHSLHFIATPLAVVESSCHKTYLMFTTFKLTHAHTHSLAHPLYYSLSGYYCLPYNDDYSTGYTHRQAI